MVDVGLNDNIGSDIIKKIEEVKHISGKKAMDMDEKNTMDDELLNIAFKKDIMNLDYYHLYRCVEEISKVNQAFAITIAAHYMSNFALSDLIKIKKEITSKRLSCFALTEPHSGSDLKNIKTEVKDGKLIGVKTLITNAEKAEIFTVLAKNNDKYFLCIVDLNDLNGNEIEIKKLNSSVFRGSGLSAIKFNSTPVSCMIEDGLKKAMNVLNLSRPIFSSIALGISEGCIDRAKGYMFYREIFGKKISEFQGLRWMFAEVYAEVEALRCVIEKFVDSKDFKLSPVCKYLAAKTVKKAADFAVEVMGGHGLIRGCYVERAYRDAKAFDIGEGTTEIIKTIIAKEALR